MFVVADRGLSRHCSSHIQRDSPKNVRPWLACGSTTWPHIILHVWAARLAGTALRVGNEHPNASSCSLSTIQSIVSDRVSRLSDGEVQVWGVSTDSVTASLEGLRGLLSPAECTREKRFQFEEDRVRFVVARGTLRLILASHMGVEPDGLRISTGAHGKPTLADGLRDSPVIHFNTAHSHGLVLHAIARDRQVGVDIEFVRAIPDADQISDGFFSPSEKAMLRGLERPSRLAAFYTCWTRKEAYLKANGSGLTAPLIEVDILGQVQPQAGVGPVYRIQRGDGDWYLHDLKPAPGYVGAVAYEGSVGRVTHHYLWTVRGT